MMNQVELYGSLGKRFGKEQTIWGETPRACILGLCSEYPTMRKELLNGRNWQLFLNGEKLKQAEIDTILPDNAIVTLVPVINGGELLTAAFYIISAIMLVSAVYMYTQMPDASDPGGEKSYMFNGAVNSNEQGGPVPLVYGHARVGSIVISSAITNEEMQDSRYSNLFGGPGSPYRGSFFNGQIIGF